MTVEEAMRDYFAARRIIPREANIFDRDPLAVMPVAIEDLRRETVGRDQG